MAVTMKKVAHRAGVSVATVSRVLTGHPNVREETSRKVRQTMEELGYTPNIIAQNLVSRTTRCLCVLLPGTAEQWAGNLFFMELIRGIVLGAGKLGYDIQIVSGSGEQEELAAVSRLLKGGRADGAILLSSRKSGTVVEFLKQGGYPFVLVEDDRASQAVNRRQRPGRFKPNTDSGGGSSANSPSPAALPAWLDDSISQMGSLASQLLIESLTVRVKEQNTLGNFIKQHQFIIRESSILSIGV